MTTAAASPSPVSTALSARSVVLSLLLGSHPHRMSAAGLVRAGEHFAIPASTLRVALTRAVASGDLQRVDGDYALGERLVRRQRHQDEGVLDQASDWAGQWEMAVVVVTGRPGSERAALRDLLGAHRLAELREGVWLRPANLNRPPAYADEAVLTTFRCVPDEDPQALAARLWDLTGLAAAGEELLARLDTTTDPVHRLAVAAAVVRTLADDPLLPAALLPAGWPAARLRTAYAAYQEELRELALGGG